MKSRSFLSIDDLESSDISFILDTAQFLKKEFVNKGRITHCINRNQTLGLVAHLLFVEPSTRTRASFELACGRLGIAMASLWNLHFSSMVKGESLDDTIQCLIALKPSVIILRCGANASRDVLQKSDVPIINAGLGVDEHPTQALTDVFTIQQARGVVDSGTRVLIVGDVLHSRVANSNLKLLKRLGASLGFCAPKELSPKQTKVWEGVQRFESLEAGIKWANVIMCLRMQKERHTLSSLGFSMAEYRDKYYIGKKQMDLFKKDGILLHPGPAVRGVEIDSVVLEDSRCRIIDQVENSAYVRCSVICRILNLDISSSS